MLNARRSNFFLSLSFVGAALLMGATGTLTACGGSDTSGSGGGGTSGGADCFDYSSFDGMSPAVSFSADVLPIFRGSCGLSASCHQTDPGNGAQHFLGTPNSSGDMTPMQIASVLGIVGKAAVEEPSIKVVEAGKPETSFLMYKIDGLDCDALKCSADKSCGTIMPQGGAKLSQDQRDTIRRWIAQGAQNN